MFNQSHLFLRGSPLAALLPSLASSDLPVPIARSIPDRRTQRGSGDKYKSSPSRVYPRSSERERLRHLMNSTGTTMEEMSDEAAQRWSRTQKIMFHNINANADYAARRTEKTNG